MRLLPLLFAGSFLACTDPEPGAHFISPYDGQTDWPPAAPLQVRVGEPVAPEGREIDPDLIVVVNLDQGGRIEGEVVADATDLWFFPDEPFPAGRYTWSVGAPYDEARSVHLTLPPAIQGAATFHTGPLAEPLGAVRLDDELCVVLSRGGLVQDDGFALTSGLTAYVDGTRVRLGPDTEVSLTGVDAVTPSPASIACLVDAAIDVASAEGMRVESDVQVWQLPVQDRTVDEVLTERHRLGAAASEGSAR